MSIRQQCTTISTRCAQFDGHTTETYRLTQPKLCPGGQDHPPGPASPRRTCKHVWLPPAGIQIDELQTTGPHPLRGETTPGGWTARSIPFPPRRRGGKLG